MKYTVIISIIVIPFMAQAAAPQNQFCITPRLVPFGSLPIDDEIPDEDDDAGYLDLESEYYANTTAYVPEPEQFDHFFCDATETALANDALTIAQLKKSLFIQLCVQAARVSGPQANAVNELLTKIKREHSHLMEQDPTYWHNNPKTPFYITPKDLEHRLLSAIPRGHTRVLVNDQKIRLQLLQHETAADAQENARRRKEEEEHPTKPPVFEWGRGWSPPAQQRSARELIATRPFEEFPEHHDKVVKEFEQLLSKFQ